MSDPPDDNLDAAVRRVAAPYGGPADRQAAELALAYLLANADAAHPRLLALLGTDGQANPVTVISVLPQFGRAASVPILAQLLARGPDPVRMAAADALARHPLPEARAALERGLQAADPVTVSAAADGLRLRADPSACDALRARLEHDDAGARYALLRASAALGCLTPEVLTERVRDDPDPDIRALAS